MRDFVKCLICWDELEPEKHVVCVYCNIALHRDCDTKNRGEKNYTQCPHCQRVGCLGVQKIKETNK